MTDPDRTDAELAAIIAAEATAADELLRALAAAEPPDLSDIIAAGEAAAAELARTIDATASDAELRAALFRLAQDHPVYVPPPPRPPVPVDEPGPIDSLAGAADVLRAYLDADPAVTLERAYEALTVVERAATAGDNLLPPAAVAARLGVSVDTVRRLISEGQLPAVRLGYRTMRVPVEGLAAYRARLDDAGRAGVGRE